MRETREIDGIDVLIEGEGDETIVMIHGWPDTLRLWDAQVVALQSRWRCVRFTLPGFDLSKPRRPTSLDAMVALFKTVVEQTAGGRPVTLMLHDWGAVFGYQFALRHPSLVSRIVGVDIGDTSSRAYLASLSLKSKLMIFAYQAWLALAWCLPTGIGDAMSRRMAHAMRCPTDEQHIGAAMNYPYFIQWTGAYGGYRHAAEFVPPCPMLYLYGARKPFLFHSPGWAEALARRPDSAVHALPTGHWVMREDAEGFNAIVLRWLAQTSVAAAPAQARDTAASH
jgi:pimeloyl-ACP methyl ester carboxylesterase